MVSFLYFSLKSRQGIQVRQGRKPDACIQMIVVTRPFVGKSTSRLKLYL